MQAVIDFLFTTPSGMVNLIGIFFTGVFIWILIQIKSVK